MKLSSIKSQGYFVNGLTFIYKVALEVNETSSYMRKCFQINIFFI